MKTHWSIGKGHFKEEVSHLRHSVASGESATEFKSMVLHLQYIPTKQSVRLQDVSANEIS